MKPKEVMGQIYLSGQVMLPLDKAHEIQSILAKYARSVDYVYRAGDEEYVYYTAEYETPYVQVLKSIPHLTTDGLTSKQINEWKDVVRDSKGGNYLSPQDFTKLSEEPK